MATAISACENKNPQKKKPFKFSRSEIEAAKQLIQLSSSSRDSDEEEEQQEQQQQQEDLHSSSNSFSYSVLQGNPDQEEHSTIKADTTGGDVSSVAATAEEDVLAAEDESCFPIRNDKRYRFIEDLYSVTVPVPAVKPKKVKSRK